MEPIMTLPSQLQRSYRNRHTYPENLDSSSTSIYSSKLKAYRKLLDDAEPDLCLVHGRDSVNDIFEVPIIDLDTSNGQALRKQYIHSPSKLAEWIGVEVKRDLNDPNNQEVVASIKDPKCRFIYLYSQHSRDKLKITRSSLVELCTYHQIMPAYLDFMLVFGSQDDPKDLRFSGFREQVKLKRTNMNMSVSSLGRSGRYFQLCYNLKSVQRKSRSNDNVKLDEWSIRQAAVYHQFDVENGSTLWVVTKGGEELLERYEDFIGDKGRPEDKQFGSPSQSLVSSLSTHLLFCHWSTEDWRWYIRWLEEVIEHESGMAVHGPRGDGYAHKEYRPYHIQDLQLWQDRANEAVMVLESNTDILKSIQKFYDGLVTRKDFPRVLTTTCEEDLQTFSSQLEEIINDFHMQTSRAKLLVKIISDRKELVLQHLQGQAAERTEKLNKNLEREAVVMRIVTIVTLVYLPATFTSTFFSTDVVKYQDQNQDNVEQGKGSFSGLALTRWLQVTLPLTALTLLVAWSTYKIYDTSRSGMTIPERVKDIFTDSDSAPAALIAQHSGNTVHTQGRSTWMIHLATLFKPARAHTRWPQSSSPSLPLHAIGRSKSKP